MTNMMFCTRVYVQGAVNTINAIVADLDYEANWWVRPIKEKKLLKLLTVTFIESIL